MFILFLIIAVLLLTAGIVMAVTSFSHRRRGRDGNQAAINSENKPSGPAMGRTTGLD